MNVDILATNPDWRWYILFVSTILAATILGWLLFKYGQVCYLLIKHIPSLHADKCHRLRSGLKKT
jgi:hypothetical protein